MVFSYYLLYAPYKLSWHLARLFRRKKQYLLHIEDSFDYFLYQNIGKHLPPLDLVVNSAKLIPHLQPLLPSGARIYRYPFCFPDGVLMFRNAAWKYPVKEIKKIGLEHGAYNFKRFPKSYYYNLFDLYLMTSFADVKRLQARGVTTVKAIGYPKSDALFDGSYSPEMLQNLKEKLGFHADKPTVLFSSTWDGSGMSAIHKWFDKLDILKADYNLLVTLHPRMSERYKAHFRQQKGLHYVEAMDIYPFLMIADVCVGDTNSLIAEFCIVNRPIITFSIEATARTMDDVIELIKSVSLRVDTMDEMPAALQAALREGEDKAMARKELIRTLIEPLDGQAGKRAAQEILRVFSGLEA